MPAELILQHLADAIDRGALAEPPADLSWFAREETLGPQAGCERRRYRRYSLITNVIVLPLDENLDAAGSPFVALSSGLSIGGIRLIHTDPAPSGWLLVEVAGQPVRYLVSVLRSRPVGHCFEIAGELIDPAAVNLALRSPEFAPADERNPTTPTVDEWLQWAGVTGAVALLAPSRPASRRA